MSATVGMLGAIGLLGIGTANADVLGASANSGVVRIYNPQDFSQSGEVRVTPLGQAPGGADVIIPYTLPAHNVQNVTVEPGLVRVTPEGESPNPVVDFETNPEGGIASPALFTDLSVKHATGNGTGNVLIIGKEGGQVVVSQYQADGKPLSASTLSLPMGGAISAPVNGTFSVDFLNGTGAVAFENGEQRSIDASYSLLSTVPARWVRPASIVLKPSTTEVHNIVAADATSFATYLSQDSAFLAKYGDIGMIAENLRRWTDGNSANGEFVNPPIKVVGSQLYLMVSKSTDVVGLSSKKVPIGYKVTVNAPQGREMMLALLGGEVERNLTVKKGQAPLNNHL
jgi:hypothetical protein